MKNMNKFGKQATYGKLYESEISKNRIVLEF